jgi:acyl carrier protein
MRSEKCGHVAVGLRTVRLTDNAAFSDFADSITVMRVRDRIKRQTGRKLSILEIAEAGTIGKLIEILQSRSSEKAEIANLLHLEGKDLHK